VKKAVKIMMPIFSVRTFDGRCCRRGMVLAEVLVVVLIVSLMTGIVMFNLGGIVFRSEFEKESQRLLGLINMAADAAATTDRRYEMVFDFFEQQYTLRELVSLDTSVEVEEESVIERGNFTDEFVLAYIQFDDLEMTNEETAYFRVGKSGWQYGGKIVLLDGNGNEYSLIINRLSGVAEIRKGDVDFLIPLDKDEMPF
jgi:type II secretory pathway pseudopilin PulG